MDLVPAEVMDLSLVQVVDLVPVEVMDSSLVQVADLAPVEARVLVPVRDADFSKAKAAGLEWDEDLVPAGARRWVAAREAECPRRCVRGLFRRSKKGSDSGGKVGENEISLRLSRL